MFYMIISNIPLVCNNSVVDEKIDQKKNVAKNIKVDAKQALAQEKKALSLKGRVFKWLKDSGQSIVNLFRKIFCCCKKAPLRLAPVQVEPKIITKKKTKPKIKPVKPNENLNRPDLIETKIVNGEGQVTCREILKGIGADIELVPMLAAGAKQGKILMPKVFTKDLHRTSNLFISGKKSFNIKGHTIETVEAACNEMFNILGKNVAIAAGRLLNQASFAPAYVSFFQEKLKLGNYLTRQCEKSQFDIDIEGEKVLLKVKYAFMCMKVKNDLIPNMQNRQGEEFIGIEARYIVSKKELDELGALSVEELKKLDAAQIAPSAEAVYSYTKLLPSEDEAFQAIGIKD